jgi:hypothetical protein
MVAEATPLDEKILCNIEKRAVSAEEISHKHGPAGPVLHKTRKVSAVRVSIQIPLLRQDRSHGRTDFLVIGMATGLLLGVDQFVADDHLEDTAPRRNQREFLDLVLELFEDFACHAHGTVSIPSNSAVFDTQFHAASLHTVVVDLGR